MGLPTACALVYAQLTGTAPDPAMLRGMQALLDDVARALSRVVPIYAQHVGARMPVAIAPADLADDRFSEGAHCFTTKAGWQLHGLTIQRADMTAAIAVFKAAGITFARHS